MKPTTCDTAYFGGIEINMHMIGHQVPFLDLRLLLHGQACGTPRRDAGAAPESPFDTSE
jgi:hypothetical protein